MRRPVHREVVHDRLNLISDWVLRNSPGMEARNALVAIGAIALAAAAAALSGKADEKPVDENEAVESTPEPAQ